MAATPTLAAAGCAPAVTSVARQAASAVLDEVASIDLHSHPGMVPSMARATMDGHIARLREGRVRASRVCAVADGPVLTVDAQGRIYARREPRPGELHRATYAALDAVRGRAGAGTLTLVERIADLERAREAERPGAVLAVEGGDIQTEPPRHGGLTAFGRAAIREMNRLGMLVDVAHATFDVENAAAETSSAPMVLSHTVVGVPGFARAVTREHARLVADRGGVVGGFPVAFGGAGFGGFIDHVARMADAVGIDHVAIGTDMDGIPVRLSTFGDYGEWPSLPAALLTRGFGREDPRPQRRAGAARHDRGVAGARRARNEDRRGCAAVHRQPLDGECRAIALRCRLTPPDESPAARRGLCSSPVPVRARPG